MDELITYCLRITPGLVLITALFLLLPRKQIITRIFVLILGFVLMRDAMTPTGLWEFGISAPAVWLRFIDSALALTVVGLLSLLVSWLLLRMAELRKLVRWGRLRDWKTYAVGLATGIVVALPFILIGLSVPLDDRGGAVAMSLLPALLFMSYAGNFLEELIFRGFLQSQFEKQMTSSSAALLSGMTFAAAHIFLAMTVTDLGWPILLFVLLEGIVCAFVYRRYGLAAAAMAHGTAIFVLAAGII